MRFLFHHIPKCAGRYLITQFRNNSYQEKQYSFESEEVFNFKFSQFEDDGYEDFFVETEDFFPSHYNWHRFMPPFRSNILEVRIRESIKRFKKNGYDSVTFVRDPREALCSLYFYFWERMSRKWKSSAAARERWRNRHTGLLEYPRLNNFLLNVNVRFVPEWWEDFDYVGVVDDSGKDFKDFFEKYGLENISENIVGKSRNKGYHELCKQGIIKEETQEFLESSEDFKVFEDLVQRYR